MIKFLLRKKRALAKKNFFDYPAGKQKKIIVKASKEAGKEQKKLVERYNQLYSTN